MVTAATNTPLCPELRVTIPERRLLDDLLNEAVTKLLNSCPSKAHGGVLVTRHTTHDFSVALNDEVPRGEVRELTLW